MTTPDASAPDFAWADLAAAIQEARATLRRFVADALAATIRAHEPYSFTTERELHEAVLATLKQSWTEPVPAGFLPQPLGGLNWPVHSEYRASDGHSRLDLLLGPIAVEFKIKGSDDDLVRQVQRYLRLPEVEHVLIVTTKASHAKYVDDAVAFGVLPEAVTTVLLQGGAW